MGSARAKIVPAEFLDELLLAVDDAGAAFDAGFRGIAPAALTHELKRTPLRNGHDCA